MSFTSDNITYTISANVMTAVTDMGTYAAVLAIPEWLTAQIRRNLTGDIADGEEIYVEVNNDRIRITARVITPTIDKEYWVVLHNVPNGGASAAASAAPIPAEPVKNPVAVAVPPPVPQPDLQGQKHVGELSLFWDTLYADDIVVCDLRVLIDLNLKNTLRCFSPRVFRIKFVSPLFIYEIYKFISTELKLWQNLEKLELSADMYLSVNMLVDNPKLTFVQVGQLVKGEDLALTNVRKVIYAHGPVKCPGVEAEHRSGPW